MLGQFVLYLHYPQGENDSGKNKDKCWGRGNLLSKLLPRKVRGGKLTSGIATCYSKRYGVARVAGVGGVGWQKFGVACFCYRGGLFQVGVTGVAHSKELK